MSNTQQALEPQTITLCGLSDLIPNSGICAEVDGQQIALFYLPSETPQVYAIGNWDPIGKANVLARGIVGDIDGRLVVASPLYKQHFDLLTGECLEDDQVSVAAFSVTLVADQVLLSL
ncbi:MAG: nitrite reductase small subunit NirD [Porticoccaceae bacterium]|nr:nitrite reductase small subunit NirD [Porticoccaceae bacterium]